LKKNSEQCFKEAKVLKLLKARMLCGWGKHDILADCNRTEQNLSFVWTSELTILQVVIL